MPTDRKPVVQETTMNRRTLIGAVAASATLPLLNRAAGAQTFPKTRNVVFVHGLFADGSCWSKVIAPPADRRQLHQRAESFDLST
jgi:hypothetical protein